MQDGETPGPGPETVGGLGGMPPERSKGELHRLLRSEATPDRVDACIGLAVYYGDESGTVACLRDVVTGDGDHLVRDVAAAGLAMMSTISANAAARTALTELVQSGDVPTVKAALAAIGTVPSPWAEEALEELTLHEDPGVCQVAQEWLQTRASVPNS